MAAAVSLFDAPAGPVLPLATDWVTDTLYGSVAVSLCVIAVAVLGLTLMTGRLELREAARMAIACFLLLGAPIVAEGLRGPGDRLAPGTVPVTLEAPFGDQVEGTLGPE